MSSPAEGGVVVTATVKNWSEFQHYRNRCPPWIKLQKSLLDNFDFARLPIASKALAPLLWLLASESMDGEVRIDPEWLAFRLHMDESDIRSGLTPLIDKGFLILASGALADCLQDACLEGEGEAEGETEGEVAASAAKAASPAADLAVILEAYHRMLPKCQRAEVIGPKRKRLIAAAVKQAKALCRDQGWPYDAAEFWDAYFAECAADPWLRGDKPNPKNPDWKQKLDTVLDETRFTAVMDRALATMRASA